MEKENSALRAQVMVVMMMIVMVMVIVMVLVMMMVMVMVMTMMMIICMHDQTMQWYKVGGLREELTSLRAVLLQRRLARRKVSTSRP